MIKDMSIRNKLIAVLGILMVTVIVAVVVNRTFQLQEERRADIAVRLLATEEMGDEVFDTLRLFLEQYLRGIAAMPQIHDAVTGGGNLPANQILYALQQSINVFDGDVPAYPAILVFDAQGYKVAESEPIAMMSVPPVYQQNFERARAGAFHISNVTISPQTGLTQFWFTYPVMVDGAFGGMVAMPVNTQAFGYYLNESLSEDNAYILIADAAGQVFFSTHPEYRLATINDIGSGIMVYDDQGMFFHQSGVSGMNMMAHMDSCSATGWIYLAFFDRDLADVVILDLIIQQLPIAVASFLGMLLFMFVVDRLLKPMKELENVANQVARGNMAVNIRTDRNDEVGKVSRAFAEVVKSINIMTDSLKEGVYANQHGNILYKCESTQLEGAFADVLSMVNDITYEYVLTMDNLTDPFLYIDAGYKLLYANNVMQDYTGIKGDAIVGMHINDVVRADIVNHPVMVKAFRNMERTDGLEMQLKLNDKELFDIEFSIVPFPYEGKACCALVLLKNTTRVSEMQRRSERQGAYRMQRIEKLTNNITNAFEKGNLALSVTKSDYDEETKDIAAVQDSIEDIVFSATGTIKGYVDEITNILRDIANNNFDVTITREFIGDFGSIKDSIGMIVESVSALVAEIRGASGGVEVGAEQISKSTQELMAGFEEQASAIDEVREIVKGLADKARKNSEDALSVNALSKQVRDAANSGSKNMAVMSDAMEEIKESSFEISKVVKTIEDIAFQTNLLALNASVEAARAGEHGRGFAVVAEEVRNLARRSAEAVSETSEKLDKSLSSVESGVARTKQTTEDLQSIVEITAGVADAMANITQSSQEQTDEISRIQNSMENLTRSASDNSGAVQGAASVSEELSSQASQLRTLIERFRVKRR